MSGQPADRPGLAERRTLRLRRVEVFLAALGALFVSLGAILYYVSYRSQIGIEQPIPFSHRFHVGTKQLSCVMCHPRALDSAQAGVPPLETCMLCHEHVAIHYPPIAELREHYFSGRPVVWKQVNDVPDFVYFVHGIHLERGTDCGRCHGDVRGMDRVVPARKFDMGFCMECHRDNGATHDCFTCHR